MTRTAKPLQNEIRAAGRLLAATVGVERLTPETRPAAIRAALRSVIGERDAELQAFLRRIIAEGFRISMDTINSIEDELRRTR